MGLASISVSTSVSAVWSKSKKRAGGSLERMELDLDLRPDLNLCLSQNGARSRPPPKQRRESHKSKSMEQFKGQSRLPKFAVPKRYDIHLKPDLTACNFAGSVAIHLHIVADTTFIVLNAADLSVHSASLSFDSGSSSSKVLEPSKIELVEADEILVLEFPHTLPLGIGVLNIAFQGTLNDKMKGFYRSTYEHNGEKKNMAVTQFEPADARRCFPCWDEPACK
ncbi:hypothetical protein CMV_022526, partial [Castanea mollissima]